MKKTVIALVLILAVFAYADGNDPSNTPGSTAVHVTASQATTYCIESNVAAGSGIALTIPALASNYFYITSVNIEMIAIAAPVATLVAVTSTGTIGTISYRFGVQAAVGTQQQIESYTVPLKSASPGVAVVFTGATLANLSQNMRVCGFYNPK